MHFFKGTIDAKYVLGLDPGYANCGYALIDMRCNVVRAGTFETDPKLDFWLRLMLQVESVMALTGEYPLAVAMEGYQFYSNKTEKSANAQGRLNAVIGAFTSAFVSHGCETALYLPTERTRLGNGSSRTNKAVTKQAVKMRFSRHVCKTDHEADALLLADVHRGTRQGARAYLRGAGCGVIDLSR